MPIALIIIGIVMVVTGGRGTYSQFGSQLASEFQGQNSFTYWLIGIIGAGSLGYIPTLQTVSRLLMALIVLSIFLSHKGFFQQFQNALKQGPTQPQTVTMPSNSAAPSENLGSFLGSMLPSGNQSGSPTSTGPLIQFQLPQWLTNPWGN